jgi:hypothetical protein
MFVKRKQEHRGKCKVVRRVYPCQIKPIASWPIITPVQLVATEEVKKLFCQVSKAALLLSRGWHSHGNNNFRAKIISASRIGDFSDELKIFRALQLWFSSGISARDTTVLPASMHLIP